MLFNSYIFLFVFLPVVLSGFYLIKCSTYHHLSIAWLFASSLFFYAWWNPHYLVLILCSILFNYTLGREIGYHPVSSQPRARKACLIIGVGINLAFLGYFKYTNFFINNLNHISHTQITVAPIVLPLAISFFTFQQIAYLMDIYRGTSQEHRFLHYALFVTFFPHLIAGPLVHPHEMLPQFTRQRPWRQNTRYFAIGMTIFIIGLCKKTLVADSVSSYVTDVFDAAANGEHLTFLEAWGGALSYTYQLYFDFSGYSDMAIGLALLFGIRLPLNFYSPYKAINIIDFWTRWHMSLSRFLFTYLYIPLRGNRKGTIRQCINILIVMGLGGLWHGAAWGFVIWGTLHGIYLVINHLWRWLRTSLGQDVEKNTPLGRFFSRSLTFFLVVVAWVFFRAKNLTSAIAILNGMLGVNGLTLWKTYYAPLNRLHGLGDKLSAWGVGFNDDIHFRGKDEIAWLIALSLVVWFAPNTHQLMSKYKAAINIYRGKVKDPIKKTWFLWRPTLFWAIVMALLAVMVILNLSSASEFIYFRF